MLSVINLYKQKVTDIANFPRVIRSDFFNLVPGQTIQFPDNEDYQVVNEVPIPLFDAIISNFPFIQQEDIPNEILTAHFRGTFAATQAAFMKGRKFAINERSDYYIYCFYQSLRFLKDDGMIAAITSNAWLGKNYGFQFKRFLLDNFHIRYVVRSTAEHWFKDSKVSTIFITLQRGQSTAPARFITIAGNLETMFEGKPLSAYEQFYAEIDHCDNPANVDWQPSADHTGVYERKDGSIRVSLVTRSFFTDAVTENESWSRFFISPDPFAIFRDKLINPFSVLYDVGRGTRTGWDAMHIITDARNETLHIEREFLLPILKSSGELTQIAHTAAPATNLFVCDRPLAELRRDYPNAYRHVCNFEGGANNIGKPLTHNDVLGKRQSFWYTLSSEDAANIFISINPSDKMFFAYTPAPVFCNQRLVAMRAEPEDVQLLAALLNSIVSLLFVEVNGVERNMGALDLNADFFKTKMKVLNPALLNEQNKKTILDKFAILSGRAVKSYNLEYSQSDRKAFDKAVLVAFGYDVALLPKLYALLTETIKNRVEMQHR